MVLNALNGAEKAFWSCPFALPGTSTMTNLRGTFNDAMCYDANEVMDGVTEVLAYGTAVQVEPLGDRA